jgi:hypothetical protein
LAAWTFAGLSIAADLLAIVLPSAAAALWWNRRRILSASAWMVWGLVASTAMLASLGFASLHLGDTAAARASIVTTAAGHQVEDLNRLVDQTPEWVLLKPEAKPGPLSGFNLCR